MRYWLVIPAAGLGQRLGASLPKQYLEIAGRSLLEWALSPFVADPRCAGIVVALAPGDRWWPSIRARIGRPVLEAAGGAERGDSVRRALEALASHVADDPWVLVHDAARPCVEPQEIDALLVAVAQHERGGLLALPLADTLKRQEEPAARPPAVAGTQPRAGLWRAATPQAFRLRALLAALQAAAREGRVPTDEAQAIEWAGLGAPLLVAGSSANIKVTTPADLALVTTLLESRIAHSAATVGHDRPSSGGATMIRVGSGFDVHAFGPGDHVMLGGVRIAHGLGVVAHSDGDVLLHALCDALLGAAGLGDIGQHFPDSDPRWRGVASAGFVEDVVGKLAALGWRCVNADLTLLAEAPRIGAHRAAIQARVAGLLRVDGGAVNLKATTTEKLGFVGRAEGLAAQASVLIERA